MLLFRRGVNDKESDGKDTLSVLVQVTFNLFYARSVIEPDMGDQYVQFVLPPQCSPTAAQT